MFCFQCQETAKNTGCTIQGVCGKKPETASFQDLLVFVIKGNALIALAQNDIQAVRKAGHSAARALFMTITNANFDTERIRNAIRESLELRKELTAKKPADRNFYTAWEEPEENWEAKAEQTGIMSEPDEDIRSLKELVIYGLKGIAAYTIHADNLGHESDEIWTSILETLASLTQKRNADELLNLVTATGNLAVSAMALLDKANTQTYGNPEITRVNIGTGSNPGILISGHDLKDMESLLEQTKGTGIDIYTHSEMLPAHYYPAFRKYSHFVGNYGNAWWKQDREFGIFNGPILMTTNCIVPVRDSYRDRIYTTGEAGYPGIPHIEENTDGTKDFTPLIVQAKKCLPPIEIETGEITGGFAHAQVLALADKIVDAVKSGKIRRFIVMGGCDGRQKGRSYYTDLAQALPQDTVILTAGCAKYRYNKLELGDIGGIPRVLDAGQCNDSYSLALIALKLKEIFGLDDINKLPLSFDIAWYEQKAVAVLLALLALGVKGIRLGPTLPAFVSPGVAKILVEEFGIKQITGVEDDIEAMLKGA